MQRRILYFINPISGTRSKGQLIELIKEMTAQRNIPFEIAHTNAEGNYGFLGAKIDAENITDLVVCGGDGTVNQIANAVQNMNVNIGIVPMGSGNGLALSAGIPKNAAKALQVIFGGNAAYCDGFFINTHFSCMLCGLGFDAQVAHDFAAQPSRGLKTYVAQTLKNFKLAKPYQFSISINGTKIETEAFFISIANSNQFGNNFTIAPKASLNDGLLDIVIVKKMNKMRFLMNVGKQIFFGNVADVGNQKQIMKGNVLYYQTASLQIENTSLAPLHIDGDPVRTAPNFEVTIKPKAFKLLQPK